MILAFSTVFPKGKGSLSGKRTFFTNKIVTGLWKTHSKKMNKYISSKKIPNNMLDNLSLFVYEENLSPKIHTIRRDLKNRWKAGNDIHFYINVRTKNQFQFAPVVKVKSIQKIEISYHFDHGRSGLERWTNILIDGVELDKKECENLAVNDGFEDLDDFFNWFDEDFTGKIIHWTDLKY